jgi:hypothetical protein
METRMALPHFFLIGAPKAGTTALHAALATHPQLSMSRVKEPKFFLGDGEPPARPAGPGDAHSVQETVWRRDDYEALWPDRPGALRGESTPFYLYDEGAPERLHRLVPEAKLIAVLRDPVDRAHSNWMHLWSDGLEPIADFVEACDAEEERVAAGYAPFWHYRGLGRYGEQLERLLAWFDASQVHVLRYRELVDDPAGTLTRITRFLGVEDLAGLPPRENSRPFVRDTPRTRLLARAVRAGAAAGALAPPEYWRRASRPLLWALHRNGTARPRLTPDQRRIVLGPLVDDIHRLQLVTGRSFADWLGDEGRGAFDARRHAEAATSSA